MTITEAHAVYRLFKLVDTDRMTTKDEEAAAYLAARASKALDGCIDPPRSTAPTPDRAEP